MNNPQLKLVADLTNEALDLLDGLGATSSTTAIPGAEDVLPHIAAWTRHIVYSLRGIDALFESGYEHCVPPVLRLLIEHATAVAIVGTAPERYVEYVNETYHGAFNTQRARDAAGAPQYDELDQFLASGPDGRASRTTHRDRFLSLGETGKRLYASWLEQTQQSHASHVTGTLFLRPTPGSDVPTLTTKPQWTIDPIYVFGACLDCLTLALDVFSSLIQGDPLRLAIDGINTRKDVLFATMGAYDREPPRRHIDVVRPLPEPTC
jgi:hypothetical protein